jgi:4-hydroxythreonine-4-phosphate dehydrogenase
VTAGELPLIAVTIGDPAGVGPEIAVRSLADERVQRALRAIVVGDASTVEQAVDACGLALRVRVVEDAADAGSDPGTIDVLQVGPRLAPIRFGEIDAAYGAAAASYIERAVELARAGAVDGIVTGPINKEALRASGSPYPGHTEMLAELFEVPIDEVLTMFTVERLRIFFLTRHHSLRAAIDLLEVDLVLGGLRRAQELMLELGFDAPRLAVAALNPHAGEHGLMGVEDDEIVRPAVAAARAEGIDARGPVPADAVFWSCRQGSVDAVLALYHDQGHIAAKTVDFFGTVSCTLGLPTIRAAAEHGTAFDIAGRWIADPGGQTASMLVAAELIRGQEEGA